MSDFFSHPCFAGIVMLIAFHRFVLLVSPTARRLRAARDLSYAYAFEQFRAHHRAQLELRRAEFGVQKERTNEQSGS